MPEKETLDRAREDAREGKSPSTQAGEFVREEMHHVREGKHGAASTKQAIAIGLSKARRAGVKLQPPRNGKASSANHQASRIATTRRDRAIRAASLRQRDPEPPGKLKEGRSQRSLAQISVKAGAGVRKKRSAAARHNSAVRASRTRRKNA